MEGLEYDYIKGFPKDVIEYLERSLSQYMANHEEVKVGITGNPEQRFAKYRTEGWHRMVVKYMSSSEKFVNFIEDYFIKTRPNLKNIWVGTSHLTGDEYYLYFVMDLSELAQLKSKSITLQEYVKKQLKQNE